MPAAAGRDESRASRIHYRMNLQSTAWLCAIAAAGPLAAQSTTDSSFAAMQHRGAMVMGVDQYSSEHQFDLLPDGGRIVLVRSASDTAGVRKIRAHLADIVRAFATGDFGHTMAVHQHELPGTAVMRQRRALIHYALDTLPGGGAVRIVTADSTAVRAIHEFLGAQRTEHRSSGVN
jgi:hypothetical protein